MSKIIGIDLGTSTSCVSVFEGGQPTVIVNGEGNRTTPSVVGFANGERKVGDAARRQAITNPKNTVYAIKRFMGLTYDKAKKEADRVTYDVVNEGGYPRVSIDGRKYTPQEISATSLQKMKKTAEDYLGTEVKEAVITVPAYFDDDQRKATMEAGQIAGLDVKRIINEPTAAALAYGVDKENKDMNIVVYDIGGGTSDVSILSFGGGVFEVISTNGDSHLGGEDFDQLIVSWLVEEFKNQEGADLTGDPMAMQRLKEAAEKAKIELSTSMSTDINLPYITAVNGTPKHLNTTLTRAKFEQLSQGLYDRLVDLCKKALELSKMQKSEIDEVILVGGSTRIPKVVEAAKSVFEKEPSKAVNPDEAVSIGACIQGAVLGGDQGVGDIVLLDVTPLNLGIETLGGVMTTLIEANTTIPCDKEEVFSTASDNQTEVTINLLQGNRPMASQNKSIGRFNLTGILPAKRGVPQIAVKVSINANGIIEVTAKDKGTGKAQSIRVEGSSSLSKEEIERMKAEAEANAEADKKERDAIDKLNKADGLVFAQEKMIEEQKDNLTSDEKSKLEGLVNELKDCIKAKDASKVDTIEAQINETWQAVSQRVYANQGQQQTQQNADEAAASEAAQEQPNVQDADFEEVS
ncbi:MAG: molecular chaperone DnaK [Bacteroidaceae bacterium]|nr:molecular chaperone DnaK [Bacteroidaceae bacterium]